MAMQLRCLQWINHLIDKPVMYTPTGAKLSKYEQPFSAIIHLFRHAISPLPCFFTVQSFFYNFQRTAKDK